jgi:hypothetical protein
MAEPVCDKDSVWVKASFCLSKHELSMAKLTLHSPWRVDPLCLFWPLCACPSQAHYLHHQQVIQCGVLLQRPSIGKLEENRQKSFPEPCTPTSMPGQLCSPPVCLCPWPRQVQTLAPLAGSGSSPHWNQASSTLHACQWLPS